MNRLELILIVDSPLAKIMTFFLQESLFHDDNIANVSFWKLFEVEKKFV